MNVKKQLTKKEQKSIVTKTNIAKLPNTVSGAFLKGGGGVIMRSDGNYYIEELKDLEKRGIYEA